MRLLQGNNKCLFACLDCRNITEQLHGPTLWKNNSSLQAGQRMFHNHTSFWEKKKQKIYFLATISDYFQT